MEEHPELIGCPFGEVHFRFSHATPMGVIKTEKIILCPPDDYVIAAGDEILMLRRTGSQQKDALPQPLEVGPDVWEPKVTAQAFTTVSSSAKDH